MRRFVLVLGAVGILAAFWGAGVVGESSPSSYLSPEALRGWLAVIASDDFEGRATFSPGLDKAAAYIADQLSDAGVTPGGSDGSYFQPVPVQTVQASNRSSLTIEVNGESREFPHGNGAVFPSNVGAPRTLVITDVEFVGYGLNLGRTYNDYSTIDARGKAVVWLGNTPPSSLPDPFAASRMLESRSSTAIDEMGAAAALSLGSGRDPRSRSIFTTTQRLDLPRAPSVTISPEAMQFLFSAAGLDYDELQAKAARGEELRPQRLKNVKLTFNLDAEYEVTQTRMTQNVIGFIRGEDPALRDTYVAFGAHYDHLGVSPGVASDPLVDRINNGADDDGSGTTALIALSRAFTAGAKPRRSLIFVWHAGEERGLWGSQYLADHPPVPIDSIVAQLNIDMIGRNRDNKDSEENTVYAVGADRISSELHNLLVDTNSKLDSPLNIDFEMNDPSDPERIYFRSDHFSYAAKGIPIIFFFTGLHPDYHQVTDSVDKIHFEKMSHITDLVYELGLRLANLDHAPVRDFKGAQMGRGASGMIQ